MITYLTADTILNLHSIIKEHYYENTANGKINTDKIQSIIDKPKLDNCKSRNLYDNI